MILIPGIIGLIIGMILFSQSHDKDGEKRLVLFFFTVIFEVVVHVYLVYAYTTLRGGIKIFGCIYWICIGLFLGALVLWLSRLLFQFDFEGFRVLTGVSAIVTGAFAGSGIDLYVAFNNNFGVIDNVFVIYVLMIAAILIALGDIVIMIRNFSPVEIKYTKAVYLMTYAIGIILMISGAFIIGANT